MTGPFDAPHSIPLTTPSCSPPLPYCSATAAQGAGRRLCQRQVELVTHVR